MKPVRYALVPAACAVALAAHAAPAASSRAAPASSSSARAAAPHASAAAAPGRPPAVPLERARRGVVVVERAGEPVAAGALLANDGRVLTALSPLADGAELEVRHPDGTVVRARVVHRDRERDLALLLPDRAHGDAGLVASEDDPLRAGARLVAFALDEKRRGGPATSVAPIGLRPPSLLGDAGVLLAHDVIALAKDAPRSLGAPILDDRGGVAAIVTKPCGPDGGFCSPVPVAVPVPVIRGFLATAPARDAHGKPWLGIQGATEASEIVRGVRVLEVQPGSPAAAAGFHGGATREQATWIVAVDGAPVPTPDALAAAIRAHAPGERADLLLFEAGRFRALPVVLGSAPDGGAGRD